MPRPWPKAALSLSGAVSLLPRFMGLLDQFSGSFLVVDAAPWPDR
ncbi:hypothetical protein ACU4HD_10875 [Cupriavidus basilensis]